MSIRVRPISEKIPICHKLMAVTKLASDDSILHTRCSCGKVWRRSVRSEYWVQL